MKVAFVCGSGISVSAGLPSVTELTNRILSGRDFGCHTDGNFYMQEPAAGLEDDVARIGRFLKILELRCDDFYRPCENQEDFYTERFGKHETNYEDIYYLLKQIQDSEFMEYENPALGPFIESVAECARAMGILREGDGPMGSEWSFGNLMTKSESYMVCVVWNLLLHVPSNKNWQDSFALFKEAYNDSAVSEIHMYTLNHDRLFETFCEEQNLHFADGFAPPAGDIRFWSPIENLEQSQARIRLLKLHGSADWFQFPDGDQEWKVENIGIPIRGDNQHCKDNKGNELRADPSRPLLLMGTFNKMLQYQLGIFAYMQASLYFNLRGADELIVCGYGFGDKGINARILDWVWANEQNRLVVIDPDSDRLMTAARGAFRKSWETLKKKNKVKFLERGIEEVSWEDVRSSTLS